MASFRLGKVAELPLCTNGHVLIEVPESRRNDACPICIASGKIKAELHVARTVVAAARRYVNGSTADWELADALALYDAWYPHE